MTDGGKVDPVIGIDLGTTNCCVAYVEGFSAKVISNRQGYKTTPSVIAITEDGRRIVGQIAARQAVTNPEHTVSAAKRLLGRAYDSPQVAHAMRNAPYPIVEGPHGDARVMLRGRMYSVPELSAILLQEMRVIAEEYLGRDVDRAVVTVPAYFNDNQRQAVRDAGRIAGLDVLRIINEPTAAALAYGFGKGDKLTIAVYDLGGGTFDVSIVRLHPDGVFEVVASTGDSYLGGEDFDDRILEWLARRFQMTTNVDVRTIPSAVQRLREAAQRAKHDLSSLEIAEVKLPFIAQGPTGPLHVDDRITRSELEAVTSDLVTRTLGICEEALRLAGVKALDIDEVILVGGMTRMPAIQWAVREFFDKPPCKGVHPDEVVALGAAIHAAAIAGEVEATKHELRDVTAHSLGIMTAGGIFDVIVPTNTGVPTEIKTRFKTSKDNQDRVKIVVLQGESQSARENELLGQFALAGLRAARAGQVEIEVSFKIDDDGIFSVSAVDLETGEAQTIEVSATSGLDEEELRDMAAEGAEYLAERRAAEHAEENRQTVERLIWEIESVIPNAEKNHARNPVVISATTNARGCTHAARAALETGGPRAIAEQIAPLNLAKSMLDELLEDDGLELD